MWFGASLEGYHFRIKGHEDNNPIKTPVRYRDSQYVKEFLVNHFLTWIRYNLYQYYCCELAMFRYLRKKAIPYLGVNKDIMNTLLQVKKRSRIDKGNPIDSINCFVIDEEAVDEFFLEINNNLHLFANKTRFQLAIQSKKHHYWMADCYIRDDILHSFTLDAAVMRATLNPMLRSLSVNIPTGLHYVFYKGEGLGEPIQRSYIDCQTFTPEHIAVVSRINPDELYDLFKHGSLLRAYTLSDESSPRDNLKFFGTETISDEHALLASLFRCMQSITTLHALPDAFHHMYVSTKQNGLNAGITLNQWMDINFREAPEGIRNLAIEDKKVTYLHKINTCQSTFFNDRSGFGFISLPILTKVKKQLLSSPITASHQITQDLKALLTTEVGHHIGSATIKKLVKKLDKLYQNKDTLSQAHYILNFLDITYRLTEYLNQHQITSIMNLLNNFFNDRLNPSDNNNNNQFYPHT